MSVAAARRLGWIFWLAVAWVLVISLAALFANFLGLDDPLSSNLDGQYLPMFSPDHILGTDAIGRDLLSRTIFGARVSLQLAYTAPFISLVIGMTLGMSAGFFRGRVDSLISIFIDAILAFPNIIAIIAVLFFLGVSLPTLILVLAFFGIPVETRVSRGNTILFAERDFVTAARAQGASNLRIITRELLPNVIIPQLSLVLFAMSLVIVIEGLLAFLGVGIQPPTPTWGKMISDGFEQIETFPHVTFVPVSIMFLTILSFNLIGDRIRSLSNIRSSAV